MSSAEGATCASSTWKHILDESSGLILHHHMSAFEHLDGLRKALLGKMFSMKRQGGLAISYIAMCYMMLCVTCITLRVLNDLTMCDMTYMC